MCECVDVVRNEGNSALATLIWCAVDKRDYLNERRLLMVDGASEKDMNVAVPIRGVISC